MRRPASVVLRMLPLLAPALGVAAARVERDAAVPMRDGVRLRADVLRPDGAGPFPVLVYRTPYGRTEAIKSYRTARRAVDRGYAVVVQDVRGRYGSEGDFVPYLNEGRDGYDTIEWAAAQPWSTGRVGSFGLSYPGAVQWLAAVEAPPHLVAMVPAMTFSSASNFVYAGGLFDMSWSEWIWTNIAPDVRVKRGLAGPRSWKEAEAQWPELGRRLLQRLPITDQPELRPVAPYLWDWLAHPPAGRYWDFLEIRGRYPRVAAAVLNLSGWYDESYGPEGAVTNYLGLVGTRPPGASSAQLLIGPWIHGSPMISDAAEQMQSGDRRFAKAGAIDYDELLLRFMDRYVRGIENGVDRERPVRVYVMGEDRWREFDTWPGMTGERKELFLAGPATPGTRPGRLGQQPIPGEPAASAFVSDPEHPVSDPFDKPGAHDYRDLPRRDDVLCFETEPLEADLRVIGAVTAEVHLSTDAPDVDLFVRLFDVAPDGTAFNLMGPGSDMQRASYRDGGPERKLLEPGVPVTLRLDHMLTGNLFRKGHRVRIVLAGAFHPHYSRNLQTGELETVSSTTRRATIRIHHDTEHRSRISLPLSP